MLGHLDDHLLYYCSDADIAGVNVTVRELAPMDDRHQCAYAATAVLTQDRGTFKLHGSFVMWQEDGKVYMAQHCMHEGDKELLLMRAPRCIMLAVTKTARNQLFGKGGS